MTKKLLALVLSMLMLVSLLPVSAMAVANDIALFDGTTETGTIFERVNEDLPLLSAFSYDKSSKTLTLNSDLKLTQGRINIYSDVTIDLGGYTITTTVACPNGSAFDIRSGKVTIQNGTIDGTNVVQTPSDYPTGPNNECDPITVRSDAEATLKELTINIDSVTGACVYAFDGGKITIESGTYSNATTVTYPYNANFKALTVNQANVAAQLVFVEGGTFIGMSPAAGDDAQGDTHLTSLLQTGYAATETSTGTFTVDVAKYTVTFMDNGENVGEQTVDYGAKVTAPEVTPEEGYKLTGWAAVPAPAETPSPYLWNFENDTVEQNETLTAVYDQISYTVVWNSNYQDDALADKTVEASRKYTNRWDAPDATKNSAMMFTKTGYAFSGWNTEADGSGTAYAIGDSMEKLTTEDGAKVNMYAQWIGNPTWIGLVVNGGTLTADEGYTEHLDSPERYTYVMSYGDSFTFPAVEKEGYDFDGWYSDEACTDENKVGASVTAVVDQRYYAKWTPNTYTIHFNLTGGEGEVPDYQVTYDTALTNTVTPPTKTGYTFNGFYTTEADTEDAAAGKLYYGADGQAAADVKWTETTESEDNTVTLYARWTPEQYFIVFDKNGGEGTMADLKQAYDAKVTLTENAFTKANSTFAGWALTADGEATIKDGAEVTGTDFTLVADSAGQLCAKLYAVWNGRSVSITFDPEGGEFGELDAEVFTKNEDGTATKTIAYGDKLGAAPEATKTGYTFEAWKLIPPTVAQPYPYDANFSYSWKDSELTYHAYWTANDVNVTYVYDNGKDTDVTVQQKFGDPYRTAVPTAPAGKVFDGWYIGETKLEEGATIQTVEEHTVTAHWTDAAYKIYFQPVETVETNEEIRWDIFAEAGYNAPLPALPEGAKAVVAPEGKIFLGYYDLVSKNSDSKAPYVAGADKYYDADGTPVAEKVVTDNVNLIAKFDDLFTINYEANAPEGAEATGEMPSQSVGKNAAAVKLTKNAFQIDGYTFAGWATKATGEARYQDEQNVKPTRLTTKYDSFTFYAYWIANDVEVTFKSEGNVVETIQEKFGAYYTLPDAAPASAEGFAFVGWFDADGNEVTAQTKVTNPDAHELTAKWDVAKVRFAVRPEGGKIAEADLNPDAGYVKPGSVEGNYVFEFDYGSKITLPKPTREGYVFLGWMNQGELVNFDEYVAKPDPNSKFATMKAAWDQVFTITVSEPTNGAVTASAETATEGDEITVTATPDTGYEIKSLTYKVDADTYNITADTDGAYKFAMPAGNVTVTAVFKAIDYTLTLDYNDEGATALQPYTKHVGDSVDISAIEWTGHTFNGWKSKLDGKIYVDGATYIMPASDDTLTAQWDIETFEITFDANGGAIEGEDKATVAYGAYATLPDVTRTGYTLKGWAVDGTTEPLYIGENSYQVTGDVTLKAQWTVNKYDLIVDYGDNARVDKFLVSENKGIAFGTEIECKQLTWTGHTFKGFKSTADGKIYEVGKFYTMPAQNDTLTGVWDIQTFEITFAPNGGTIAEGKDKATVAYGDYATLPDVSRNGYTLKGWTVDGDATVYTATNPYKVTGTVTLTAQWEPIQYTIVYDKASLQGGKVPDNAPTYFTAETSATLIAAENSNQGISFNEWRFEDKTPVTALGAENIPADGSTEVTVYAAWKFNQFTVSYDGNEPGNATEGAAASITPAGDKTVTFKNPYGELAKASLPGFTFTGWALDAAGTKPVTKDTKVETAANHTLYAVWEDAVIPEIIVTVTATNSPVDFGYTETQAPILTATVADKDDATYAYTYAWFKVGDEAAIEGATTDTYKPQGLNAGEHSYYCRVTVSVKGTTDNNGSGESAPATVKVNKANLHPVFATYPTTYNGQDQIIARLKVDSFVDSADVSITVGGVKAPMSFDEADGSYYIVKKDAEVYRVGYQIRDTDNYAGKSHPDVSETVEIAKKPVTITWHSNQNDGSYVYPYADGAEITGAYVTLAGIVEGEEEMCKPVVEGDKASRPGHYTATVMELTSANYALPSNTTQKWDIDPAPAKATVTPNELTYNGQEQKLVTVTLNGCTIEYSTDGKNWSADELYGLEAGDYDVYYKLTAASEFYKIPAGLNPTAPVKVTIAPKPIQLTWGKTELTYTGDPQAPTCEVADGYICGSDTINVTVTGQQTDVGENYPAAAAIDNDNYVIVDGFGTKSFSISAADIAGAEVELSYTSAPYNGTEKTPAIKTITFNGHDLVADTDYTLAYEDNTEATTAAKVVLTGKNNFTGTKTINFTITPRALTGIEEFEDVTYDGQDHKPATVKVYYTNAQTSEQVQVLPEDLYDVYWTDADSKAVTELVDAGTYTATIVLKDSTASFFGSMTTTLTIKPITLAFDWTGPWELTYNGKEQTISGRVAANNVVADEDVTLVFSGDTETNVGNYKFTIANIDGTAKANYVLPELPYREMTWKITPADIAPAVFTLSDGAFTYNGKVQGPTVASAYIMLDDTKVDIAASDYTFRWEDAQGNAATPKNAGTYYLAIAAKEGGNYTGKVANRPSFTIAKAALTLTAKDDTWAYGTSFEGHLKVSASGLVNDETLQTSGVTYGYQISKGDQKFNATDIPDAGAYGLSIINAASDNYEITPKSGTLTVTQKELTVAWDETAAVVEYDGQPHAPVAIISGYLATDDVAWSVYRTSRDARTYSEYTDVKHMGEGLVYDNWQIKLTGEAAGNYALPENYEKGTLTINPMTIGVVWDQTEFTYDGTSKVPNGTLPQVIAADAGNVNLLGRDVTANEGSALTNGNPINVGSYKVTATGLTGDRAFNYVLSTSSKWNSTDYTINPAPVTVSGITVNPKTYDGTTDATAYLVFDDVKFVRTDAAEGTEPAVIPNLTVTATGTYDDKNVGENKTVTITNLELTGDAAKNYILADGGQQTTATGKITPKEVTVTGITAKDKRYDKTYTAELDVTAAKIDGKVEGDELSVSATGTFASVNKGENIDVTFNITLTGNDKDNYTVSANPGTAKANILPRRIGIEWTGDEFTYDGYSHEPDATITAGHIIEGDNVTLGALTIYSDDEDVKVVSEAVNAGDYIAKAETLEDNDLGNYEISTSYNVHPFTIDPASVTIVWTGYEETSEYDGNDHAPSVTVYGVNKDVALVEGTDYGFELVQIMDEIDDDLIVTEAKNVGSYGAFVWMKDDNYTVLTPEQVEIVEKISELMFRLFTDEELDETEIEEIEARIEALMNELVGPDPEHPNLPFAKQFEITPREAEITWGTTSFTYDGKSHVPTATVKNLVAGDECTVTVDGAQINAGTYTATATALSNPYYVLPDTVPTTQFTISSGSSGGGGSTGGGGSIGGGGSGSGLTMKLLPTTNGTMNFQGKEATVTSISIDQNKTYKIEVKPAANYKIDKVTYTTAPNYNNPVEVTAASEGVYEITTKNASIEVTATFAPINDNDPSVGKVTIGSYTNGAATCDHGTSCLLNDFADLDPNGWYHDGIHYCLENGIMQGFGDEYFRPASITTRAQVVTTLWNIAGHPIATSPVVFSDVSYGDWYYDAVMWAAANGIVEGYGDGKFGPNDEITHEQIAKIFYGYAKFYGFDVSAKADISKMAGVEKVSNWAYQYIEWAVGAGVCCGVDGNTSLIAAPEKASRAELATMILNFCTKVAIKPAAQQ